MSAGQDEREKRLARKSRMVSVVIAGTMVLWLAANFLGPRLGLPGRYAILFDFLALAGFTWSLIVIYQIWRARQQMRDG